MNSQTITHETRSTSALDGSADAVRRLAAFLAEQHVWTDRHGSERLKESLARGYNADKLYCEERLALELAGFKVYFGFVGPPEVMAKDNPSAEALALERQVASALAEHAARHPLTIRVVRPAESWHGLEAVLVDNWLSRYRLLVTPIHGEPISAEVAPSTPAPTSDDFDDIPF
jgi:hypothetical protein